MLGFGLFCVIVNNGIYLYAFPFGRTRFWLVKVLLAKESFRELHNSTRLATNGKRNDEAVFHLEKGRGEAVA